MQRKTGIIFGAVVGVTGLVLVLLATIVGWAVIPNVIDKRIEEQVTLEEGTETWDKWQTTPVPIYFQIYVWNVTNPNVNFTNGEKPKLEQVGPYVFLEQRNKEEIKINLEEDWVEYRQRNTYWYDKERSGGRDNLAKDLNVVNTPFISASRGIYRMAPDLGGFFVDRLLVGLGEKFVKEGVSVQELMFDGFQLPDAYETIVGLLPVTPVEFTNNRFAYYNQRNASLEHEVYKVNAGKQDSLKFGQTMEWDGKLILDHWSIPDPDTNLYNATNPNLQNAYCNMINGTDGSIFRPFIKKDTVLRIFQTEICRSLFVTYLEDGEHMDIPGYVFTMPSDFFEYPSINEDNYCFCNSPKQFDDSYPVDRNCSKGVIRLAPCKYDSPVVTSSPHFLYANEDYLNYVEGLDPKPELHRTEILVEPNSGSMLKISKKLQISIEMQELVGMEYFKDVPHFLWPAFWADQAVQLNEYYTDDLKSQLINPLKLINVLKWTILGIGCALIGIAAIVYISATRKSKQFV